MAITVSGLYYPAFRDALSGGTLNLGSETNIKLALFSGVTPNFDSDTAYGSAPFNSGEVTGTGWSAGGVVLTTTAFSVTTGTLAYSADNVSESGTTLADSEGGLIWDDGATTPTADAAVAVIYWGAGDFSTNNGTFAVTWSTNIFTIDLTP